MTLTDLTESRGFQQPPLNVSGEESPPVLLQSFEESIDSLIIISW